MRMIRYFVKSFTEMSEMRSVMPKNIGPLISYTRTLLGSSRRCVTSESLSQKYVQPFTSVSSETIFINSTTVMSMPTAMAVTRSNTMVSVNVSSSVATAPRDAVAQRWAKLRQPDML